MFSNEEYPDTTAQHSVGESFTEEDQDVTMCICPVCGYSASSPNEQDAHMEQAHGGDTTYGEEMKEEPFEEMRSVSEPPQDSYVSSSGLKASSTPQRMGHQSQLFLPTGGEQFVSGLVEGTPESFGMNQSYTSFYATGRDKVAGKNEPIKSKCNSDDVIVVQKVDSRRRYRCNMCSCTFPWHGDLTEHLRIAHGMQKTRESSRNGKAGSFCCIHCKYVAKYQSELRRHMRLHWGVKPFVCVFCPYRSAWKGDLKRHMESHHRDRFSTEAELVKIMSQFKNNAGTTLNGLPLCTIPPGDQDSDVYGGLESTSESSSGCGRLPNGSASTCVNVESASQESSALRCAKDIGPPFGNREQFTHPNETSLDTKPSMNFLQTVNGMHFATILNQGATFPHSRLSRDLDSQAEQYRQRTSANSFMHARPSTEWVLNRMDQSSAMDATPIDLSITSQKYATCQASNHAATEQAAFVNRPFNELNSIASEMRPNILQWPFTVPVTNESAATPALRFLLNPFLMNGLLQTWQQQQQQQQQQPKHQESLCSTENSGITPSSTGSEVATQPANSNVWDQMISGASSVQTTCSPRETHFSDDLPNPYRFQDNHWSLSHRRSRRGRRSDGGRYRDGAGGSLGLKEEQWKRHQCSGCGHRSNWKWDINKHIKVAHPERSNITTITLDLEEAKRTFNDYMNRSKMARNRNLADTKAVTPNVGTWPTNHTSIGLQTEGYYRPYKCSVCGHRSNWKWDVRKHIKQVHNNNAEVITLSLDEARRTIHQYKSCRRKQLRPLDQSNLKFYTQTVSSPEVASGESNYHYGYEDTDNGKSVYEMKVAQPEPINLSCSSSSEPVKNFAVPNTGRQYRSGDNDETAHGGPRMFRYYCRICQRRMSSHHSLRFHLQFVHGLKGTNLISYIGHVFIKSPTWMVQRLVNVSANRSPSKNAAFKNKMYGLENKFIIKIRRPTYLKHDNTTRSSILQGCRKNVDHWTTNESLNTVQHLSGLLDKLLDVLEESEYATEMNTSGVDSSKLDEALSNLSDVIQAAVTKDTEDENKSSSDEPSLDVSLSSNEENKPNTVLNNRKMPIQHVLKHPEVGSRLIRFANVLRSLSNTSVSPSQASF